MKEGEKKRDGGAKGRDCGFRRSVQENRKPEVPNKGSGEQKGGPGASEATARGPRLRSVKSS